MHSNADCAECVCSLWNKYACMNIIRCDRLKKQTSKKGGTSKHANPNEMKSILIWNGTEPNMNLTVIEWEVLPYSILICCIKAKSKCLSKFLQLLTHEWAPSMPKTNHHISRVHRHRQHLFDFKQTNEWIVKQTDSTHSKSWQPNHLCLIDWIWILSMCKHL